MYKNGQETSEQIIRSAKKNFYFYGYRGATVETICRDAGVKLGTFTYYFSKKSDLLAAVYSSYMRSCKEYIDENLSGLSPAEHHLHTVMLYYFNIYRDRSIVRFHKEVLESGSMNSYFENPRAVISDFSDEGKISRDSSFYNLAVIADNAVRRELNMDFILAGKYTIDDVRSLLTEIYSVTSKLFGVEEEKLHLYMDHACAFVLDHLHTGVSLL